MEYLPKEFDKKQIEELCQRVVRLEEQINKRYFQQNKSEHDKNENAWPLGLERSKCQETQEEEYGVMERDDEQNEIDEMMGRPKEAATSLGNCDQVCDIIRTQEIIEELDKEFREEHRKVRRGGQVPMIELRFGNNCVKALVDTGAQITAITRECYEKLVKMGRMR